MEYSFLSFTFDVHMCVFHLANKLCCCCCWSVSQGASQGRSFLARAFGLARSDVATPLLTGFLLWILCANDVSVELNLTHFITVIHRSSRTCSLHECVQRVSYICKYDK